jgi:hypothetical protein
MKNKKRVVFLARHLSVVQKYTQNGNGEKKVLGSHFFPSESIIYYISEKWVFYE